jgi:hypothetical protein
VLEAEVLAEQIAIAAVARESLGFIWAIAQAAAPHPAQS